MTDLQPKSWCPSEVREKVISLVRKGLTSSDKISIENKTAYVTDLEADSIDLVELVIDLETTFDVEIPDKEATEMKTVGKTISWIIETLGETGRLIE